MKKLRHLSIVPETVETRSERLKYMFVELDGNLTQTIERVYGFKWTEDDAREAMLILLEAELFGMPEKIEEVSLDI